MSGFMRNKNNENKFFSYEEVWEKQFKHIFHILGFISKSLDVNKATNKINMRRVVSFKNEKFVYHDLKCMIEDLAKVRTWAMEHVDSKSYIIDRCRAAGELSLIGSRDKSRAEINPMNFTNIEDIKCIYNLICECCVYCSMIPSGFNHISYAEGTMENVLYELCSQLCSFGEFLEGDEEFAKRNSEELVALRVFVDQDGSPQVKLVDEDRWFTQDELNEQRRKAAKEKADQERREREAREAEALEKAMVARRETERQNDVIAFNKTRDNVMSVIAIVEQAKYHSEDIDENITQVKQVFSEYKDKWREAPCLGEFKNWNTLLDVFTTIIDDTVVGDKMIPSAIEYITSIFDGGDFDITAPINDIMKRWNLDDITILEKIIKSLNDLIESFRPDGGYTISIEINGDHIRVS